MDVLIKKMFSTITERNNILKPKALIHIFRTCCLRIFALRDPFLPQAQRIEVLMFCYWYLLSIRIRNWNNSTWRPGTDLCSSWSKTEICQESNKAETKDKFRGFKMWSTERLLPRVLPRGTVRKIKSLNTYLKIKIGDWFQKPKSVNNRNVWHKDNWTRLSLVLVIRTPSGYTWTFETLKIRLTDLFSFLLSYQTLISMIMLTNIHIWICLVFKNTKAHRWMQLRRVFQLNMIHKQSRYHK